MKNFITKGDFAGQKPHLIEVATFIVSKLFLDPGTHWVAASKGMMWSL